MGGSSKKQTVGYRYYVGMHIGLCHGPVDKLIRIDVDDKEAWAGVPITDGPLTIAKPDMFGGDSREGGISGTIDWCPGGPSQGQNDYLSGILGADLLPSFRGVCCAVLRQMYMGLNPYLKKWMFRAQRIHTAQDGAAQWYDEKSAILTGYPSGGEPYIVTADSALDVTNPNNGLILSGLKPSDVVVISKPIGLRYQAWTHQYTNQWWNAVTINKGEVDPSVVVYFSGIYSTAAASEAAASAEGEKLLTGFSYYKMYASDNIAQYFDNTGGLSVKVEVQPGATGIYDMNPAHIIRECQTNSDWGMGISSLEVDETAYVYAADKLYAENMGISILWNQQTSIDAFVSEILRHIDADIAVDNTTGKFKLKLIRDDYDESTLLELNPSNVPQITDFHKMTVAELINEVTVSYWDTITGTDKTVTVQDLAMVQVQGGVVATKIDYPGFTNASIATRVAARDLRTLSYPRTSCTLYANRVAASLNKGDVFKLSWPDYGVASMIMRITGIDLGDGLDNKIKIECTQDTFSLPEVAFVVTPEILWESSKEAPAAAENRLAFEMPYFELVQRSGQDVVDAQLASYPDAGYVGIAAVRPSSSTINSRLYTDSGAGYLEYGAVDFCPSAVLSANIGHMDSVIAISSAVDIDLVNVGTWAQIDDELVAIDAVSATSITVKRGMLDTVPATHLLGARIYFWDEFSGSDEQQYVDTDTIDIKLQTISSTGVLPLDNALVDTVTMDTRAIRPYPPGNFQVDNVYFPETTGFLPGLLLEWSHRDRLQQTAGLINFTDGNIGPEAGTEYLVNLYDETGDLKRTVTTAEASYQWDTEADDCLLPGAGSQSWTPALIPSSLLSWLDAKDANQFDDNAAIGTWYDKSGNDRHFLQSTASLKPYVTTDVNLGGQNVVKFASDYLMCLTFPATTQCSVFVLWSKPVSGGISNQRIYSSGQANSTADYVNNGVYLVCPTASSGIGAGGPLINSNIFADAVKNTTRVVLGTNKILNTEYYQGNIAEIIFTTALSVDDFKRVEGYLAWRWGIQSTLAVDHPYKTAPPVVGAGDYRKSSKVRIELESTRGGLSSFQSYDHTVYRPGYGLNYGKFYGGIA
ncbi:phage tail protein [Desulfocastanea catecholica]